MLGSMAHRGHGARRDGTQGTWCSETWRAGDMAIDYHVPRNHVPRNQKPGLTVLEESRRNRAHRPKEPAQCTFIMYSCQPSNGPNYFVQGGPIISLSLT